MDERKGLIKVKGDQLDWDSQTRHQGHYRLWQLGALNSILNQLHKFELIQVYACSSSSCWLGNSEHFSGSIFTSSHRGMHMNSKMNSSLVDEANKKILYSFEGESLYCFSLLTLNQVNSSCFVPGVFEQSERQVIGRYVVCCQTYK